jgi:hypothetical protein
VTRLSDCTIGAPIERLGTKCPSIDVYSIGPSLLRLSHLFTHASEVSS